MKLTQRALVLSAAISENILVKSINQGLILIIPLIIMGSAALVINNFPLILYQDLMVSIFGNQWRMLGEGIWNLTFGIMGLALSVTIAYSLASVDTRLSNSRLNSIITSLVSLTSLLTILNTGSSGLHTNNAGVSGVFLSIIVTVLSAELFICLNKYMNFFHMSFMDSDPVIPQALFSIIPFCLTLFVFTMLRMFLSRMGIEDINLLIIDLTKYIFNSLHNQFSASILFVLLNQVFWFFGIHGNNVLYSVSQDIYMKAIDLNISALTSGSVPVHILTKPFLDVFVLIGGSGSTLCLLIAIFLVDRKSNTAKLAKISLLPAIFNINEIIVFGLPVVLNPLFLLPYVLVPLVLTIVSYTVTTIGWVPVTIAPVNWTTPPLMGGWMATGSWRGMALQVFNIIIGTGMYFPFVKLFELQKQHGIMNAYSKLIETVLNEDFSTHKSILSRNGQIGNMAQALTQEIREALQKEEFFLEYQPQVDEQCTMFGVEALPRWNHPKYGQVPPPVIISLAEEAGLIRKLGLWVIDEAFSQLGKWNSQGILDIQMAINISPTQLQDELSNLLEESIRLNKLNPRDIELEITESVALGTNPPTVELLNNIKKQGVSIAMDDFGMGHASLYCMKHFSLDKIKIDGSLTRDVIENKSCQDIIASITYLADTMNVTVIAEYVETEEQFEMLKTLGCKQFQGYYFSKPLHETQCVDYFGKNNVTKNLLGLARSCEDVLIKPSVNNSYDKRNELTKVY